MKTPHDPHYYPYNRYLNQTIIQIKFLTTLSCKLSYVISTEPVHEIELRSGRVVNDKPKSSIIIREEDDEEEDPNEIMNEFILQDVDIPKIPVHTQPQQEPTREQKFPPFPE